MGLRLDFILTALINPIWALFGLFSPVDRQFAWVEVETIIGVQKGDQFEVALLKYNGLGVDNVERKFGDDFLANFHQTSDNENSAYYTMSYDETLCNGGAITLGMKFENTVSGDYVTPDHGFFFVQEVIEVPARWFIDNGCKTSD